VSGAGRFCRLSGALLSVERVERTGTEMLRAPWAAPSPSCPTASEPQA
jgi:hypothetical protein